MCLWRELRSSRRPASSLPTTPTGRTFTPRSARLFTAFAPPPGTTVRSRCRRMSTGASRETREISPNTNSSATMSPSTVMVMRGNAATIFRRRSASFGARVMMKRIISRAIFSRRWPAFLNHAQNSIQNVSGFEKLHDYASDGYWLKGGKGRAEIDGVFLGGDEAAGAVLLPQRREVVDIVLCVGVVVAVELGGDRLDSSRSQLLKELIRAGDTAEGDGPRRGLGNGGAPPQAPDALWV